MSDDNLGAVIVDCKIGPILKCFIPLCGGWGVLILNFAVVIPFFSLFLCAGLLYLMGIPSDRFLTTLPEAIVFAMCMIVLNGAMISWIWLIVRGMRRSRLVLHERGVFVRAFRMPFKTDTILRLRFDDLQQIKIGFHTDRPPWKHKLDDYLAKNSHDWLEWARWVGLTIVLHDGTSFPLPAILILYEHDSLSTFFQYLADHHPQLLAEA